MQRRTGELPGRVIVVHGADHARAALVAARDSEVPVVLHSPPGFAAYAGAAFFVSMIDLARKDLDDVVYVAVLDCGRAAGHALAALREGVSHIAIRLPGERRDRLANIAAGYGAVVIRPIRGGLDLAQSDDPATACREWLSRGEKR